MNLLTIRSFQDFGHKFIIHTYDSNLTTECEVRDASELYPKDQWRFYPGLDKSMELGLIGDTLRARLLHKYGGVHVDLDVTCLKEIDFESEYVFRPHDEGVVMNFVKCPAGDVFSQYYVDYTNSVDEKKNDWLGSFSGLIKGIRKYNLQKYIVDEKVLGMDNGPWWSSLLQYDEVPKSEYIIHWCNSTGFSKGYLEGSFYDKKLKQYGL